MTLNPMKASKRNTIHIKFTLEVISELMLNFPKSLLVDKQLRKKAASAYIYYIKTGLSRYVTETCSLSVE